MPFGLSNAPSTFQALMNDSFRPFLRKFVLVFFDDILIYSTSWTDHLHHLELVFNILHVHGLFLKRSKCLFGRREIAYLGHLISQSGVTVDNSKIEAILQWPRPTTVRALRGFLGLTGYYRKFVQDYGILAAPLTALLRKNSFAWSAEAEFAFQKLKNTLTATPVLALPDFSQPFMVEYDASEVGIGAVLQQQERPIAFYSRAMVQRHKKLSAYEKELIGLAKAVRHWHAYLWGHQFVVRTDHYSLKFLLEQRITTSPQQHWISKILGFDFRVEYRAGRTNGAADALSRRDGDSG